MFQNTIYKAAEYLISWQITCTKCTISLRKTISLSMSDKYMYKNYKDRVKSMSDTYIYRIYKDWVKSLKNGVICDVVTVWYHRPLLQMWTKALIYFSQTRKLQTSHALTKCHFSGLQKSLLECFYVANRRKRLVLHTYD